MFHPNSIHQDTTYSSGSGKVLLKCAILALRIALQLQLNNPISMNGKENSSLISALLVMIMSAFKCIKAKLEHCHYCTMANH